MLNPSGGSSSKSPAGGGGGPSKLELAADATVGELKDAIADKLGIPTAAQTLLTGFPPSTLTADDTAALAATLGSAPRVLVREAKLASSG